MRPNNPRHWRSHAHVAIIAVLVATCVPALAPHRPPCHRPSPSERRLYPTGEGGSRLSSRVRVRDPLGLLQPGDRGPGPGRMRPPRAALPSPPRPTDRLRHPVHVPETRPQLREVDAPRGRDRTFAWLVVGPQQILFRSGPRSAGMGGDGTALPSSRTAAGPEPGR